MELQHWAHFVNVDELVDDSAMWTPSGSGDGTCWLDVTFWRSASVGTWKMDDIHSEVAVIITIVQKDINSAKFEKFQGEKKKLRLRHPKGPRKVNKH